MRTEPDPAAASQGAQVDVLAASLNQCADDLLDEGGPSSFSISERLYELAAFHAPVHPALSQAVGVVSLAEAERVAQMAYIAGKRGYTFTGCVDELHSLALPTADQAVVTAEDGVTERVETGIAAAARYTKNNGYDHFTTSAIDAAVRAALAQPRSMGVPEEMGPEDDPKGARYRRAPERIAYRRDWNDCREAMLAAAPEVPSG